MKKFASPMRVPHIFMLFSLAVIAVSCISGNSQQEQRMHSLSTQTQRICSELADLRYQLNNFNVELDILEGKSGNQQSTLNKLQQHLTSHPEKNHVTVQEELLLLEKQIGALNNNISLVAKDLAKLQTFAQASRQSISQHDTAFKRINSTIQQQNERLYKMTESLNLINEIIGRTIPSSEKNYTVKSGDTLEKIARKHKTTIESLKQENNLTTDLIFAGQELYLP